MFFSDLRLFSLCSALAIGCLLYFKNSLLSAPILRAVLALVIGIAGLLLLPVLAPFESAITLCWIVLTAAGFLFLALVRPKQRGLRQWWAMLDLAGAGSFFAAAVYSITEIILSGNTEHRYLTLLVFALTLAACIHLFHELQQAHVLQRPSGLVLGQALLLAGAIPFCFGSRRIDRINVLCAVLGLIILLLRLRAFLHTTEERRILEKMSVTGDVLEPEYTEASLECPEPRLWSMYDPMTAEKEVLDLLYALVRALKPRLAVETGTFSGVSSVYIARAMQENGRGRLITCETDPLVYENACNRFRTEGLNAIIDCRLGSSLELEINEQIDLLYCDSELRVRGDEVRRFIGNVNPFGLILMHDAGSRFKVVREAALELEREGLLSVVLISTPRGLVVAQKRAGRK